MMHSEQAQAPDCVQGHGHRQETFRESPGIGILAYALDSAGYVRHEIFLAVYAAIVDLAWQFDFFVAGKRSGCTLSR